MRRLTDRLSAARRDDRGFTLIELLIVIVILGILAAIVVFSVRGITDRGDVAACKANVKSAEVAVEAFYAQNGSYPTAAADLQPYFHGDTVPAGIVSGYDATGATEPTIKALSAC